MAWIEPVYMDNLRGKNHAETWQKVMCELCETSRVTPGRGANDFDYDKCKILYTRRTWPPSFVEGRFDQTHLVKGKWGPFSCNRGTHTEVLKRFPATHIPNYYLTYHRTSPRSPSVQKQMSPLRLIC